MFDFFFFTAKEEQYYNDLGYTVAAQYGCAVRSGFYLLASTDFRREVHDLRIQ